MKPNLASNSRGEFLQVALHIYWFDPPFELFFGVSCDTLICKSWFLFLEIILIIHLMKMMFVCL